MTKPKKPIDIAGFILALNRKDVRHKTGVSASAIPNWIADDLIPCRYFLILSNMAEHLGVECPEHLFSFYAAADA